MGNARQQQLPEQKFSHDRYQLGPVNFPRYRCADSLAGGFFAT
jgi:hypothetical protein